MYKNELVVHSSSKPESKHGSPTHENEPQSNNMRRRKTESTNYENRNYRGATSTFELRLLIHRATSSFKLHLCVLGMYIYIYIQKLVITSIERIITGKSRDTCRLLTTGSRNNSDSRGSRLAMARAGQCRRLSIYYLED